MKLFYQYNPAFGRIYYSIKNKKSTLLYNTKHITFYNINIHSLFLYNTNFDVDLRNIVDYSSSNSSSSSSSNSSSNSSSSSNNSYVTLPLPVSPTSNQAESHI